MVLELQVIGIVFMVFMLYLTFLFYKKDNYGAQSFYTWTGVWVCGILLLLFPQVFSAITRRLEFARTFDFYFSIALMLFGITTFLNYVSVRRQERTVENLVRSIALEKKKRK